MFTQLGRANAFQGFTIHLFTTITGERIPYSVGAKAFLLAVRDALERYDPPQPQPGWRLGTGIACSYKNVGLGIGMDDYGGAHGEISEDGLLTVRVGSVDMGQGSDTVIAERTFLTKADLPYGSGYNQCDPRCPGRLDHLAARHPRKDL